MTETAVQRARKSVVVVVAGGSLANERAAMELAESLGGLGFQATYIGRQDCPQRIAAVVAEQQADSVELFLAGRGAVRLLRQLLRDLIEIGRRDVSIVVHRSARP